MVLYRMLLKWLEIWLAVKDPFQSGSEYNELKENQGTSVKQENEYYSFDVEVWPELMSPTCLTLI